MLKRALSTSSNKSLQKQKSYHLPMSERLSFRKVIRDELDDETDELINLGYKVGYLKQRQTLNGKSIKGKSRNSPEHSNVFNRTVTLKGDNMLKTEESLNLIKLKRDK